MTNLTSKPASNSAGLKRGASRLALVVMAAAAVAGCRGNHNAPQVAGWTLIEPSERHPILVSQKPVSMSVPVRRGSYGLTGSGRERVARFVHKYRATDTGNSKLVIAAPSGRSNEVAAMQVVTEIREIIADAGFAPSSVHVEPGHGSSHVRLSYLRVVAQGPECGLWPTNLANEPGNLAYPNLGCANQQNLAAMVANPADLLGPRSETPRPGDRRTAVFDKYVKGETTTASKSADEKVSTQKSE